LRYVLRLTRGDMAFAEDVVQESLLRLWRKPAVLRQCTDGVRAWLFTVARNQVIDDRRSANGAHELTTDFPPERSSADEMGPAFDKWIVSDALMTLSPDHRVAAVRAYYLGHAVADTAAHTGISRARSSPGCTTPCGPCELRWRGVSSGDRRHRRLGRRLRSGCSQPGRPARLRGPPRRQSRACHGAH
jgi:RNA polymerase sigma-70 factor, ECF subfamily